MAKKDVREMTIEELIAELVKNNQQKEHLESYLKKYSSSVHC